MGEIYLSSTTSLLVLDPQGAGAHAQAVQYLYHTLRVHRPYGLGVHCTYVAMLQRALQFSLQLRLHVTTKDKSSVRNTYVATDNN